MEKLNKLSSTAVPLPMEDIDTDQIIPARYLKGISKDGFGKNLFRDWRYDKDDQEINDFVLNSSVYNGQILVAGRNFGCGSFFADIFKGNALNNGILPITVSDEVLHSILQKIEANPQTTFSVDLPNQLLQSASGLRISFDIDAYKKECLLNGYDDIDYLLNIMEDIETYEKKQAV